MAATHIQGAWERGLTVNFNTVNQFSAFSNNGNLALSGTEADRQELFPTEGKLTQWGVYVQSNTIATSDSTIRLRKNGADGSMIITIPAGGTGWFSTPTGTFDSVAAGDKVAAKINTPNTSGALVITNCKALFAAASGTVVRYRNSPWSFALNAGTRYQALGRLAGSTTEVMSVLRSAGTIVGLHVVASNSSRSVNDVVTLRKNSVDQSMAVTVNGSGTFSNTANPVSVAVGDQISIKYVGGASASSAFFNTVVEFIPSGQTFDVLGSWEQSANAGTTNYSQLGGAQRAFATEAAASNPMLQAAILSAARTYISVYSLSAGATGRLRINGANGNQTWSINGTGEFKDLSNTDRVAPGDLVAFSVVAAAGTGSISLGSSGVTVRPLAPPVFLRTPLFIRG